MFDAFCLEESENGEDKVEKLSVEKIKRNGRERVLKLFSEEAFGNRLV